MTADGHVAGAVLTGGASRRFGSDKTAALLGTMSLVERVAAALLRAGLDPVATVGGSPPAGGSVLSLADQHPGAGPLGGLVTAMGWSPAPHVVVVAADLPLLDESTVLALADRARRCPGSVAVARADGHLQPTCACWPAALAHPVASAFAAGERSIVRVLDDLPVEPVDVPARVVADVDTPDDLARLAAVWSR